MDFRSLMPFARTPLIRPGEGDPFTSLRREMERLFEDFSRGTPGQAGPMGQGFLSPRVNVAETEKGLELTARVDQKDIDLDLTDNLLTLKARHRQEKEEKDEKRQFHLVERSTGTFMRQLQLPFEADDQNVEASFQNGVLKVFVPRRAEPENRQGKSRSRRAESPPVGLP